MKTRKSVSDKYNYVGYPAVLDKLCREEDVLIIPQFVTHYVGRQSDNISPTKAKDSRLGDRFGSSTISLNDSGKEDPPCGPLNPPQVKIIYENPEDKEKPIAVICKNMFIEYSLIQAIGKSLQSYPSINTLKIENCCISKELAENLALILAEEPGRRILDLSLDGNENLAQVLPLFVSLPNGLKILSLERCDLSDEDIKAMAEALAFSDKNHHSLQVLNLGMNKIGDRGVLYLANALRTNRSLISLSLPGNRIGDKGVNHLVEVLMKFKLTHEEVMEKRTRVFNEIKKRKNKLEKYLEEWKMKGEVESSTQKMTAKKNGTIKKIRGIDGKIRCLSSRDKRGKPVQTKLNQGEKFGGKIRSLGLEENRNALNPTPSELLAIAEQVDSEMSPDNHPFVNEIYASQNALFCYGCWSLNYINLAYNYLTEKAAKKFTEVLNYQTSNFKKGEQRRNTNKFEQKLGKEIFKQGLHELILLPGNCINANSTEFQNLQRALAIRNSTVELEHYINENIIEFKKLPTSPTVHNSKKEVSKMSDSIPKGLVSPAPTISSFTGRNFVTSTTVMDRRQLSKSGDSSRNFFSDSTDNFFSMEEDITPEQKLQWARNLLQIFKD